MALSIGVLLALAVGAMGTVVGLDRERGFYPTIMLVIAVLYTLFAAMGASMEVLLAELAVGAVFMVAAIWGFRHSLWLVVVALAAHGLMDVVHGEFITNPGVPTWWPAFCGAYDVTAAGYLAWRLKAGGVAATA